MSKSLYATAWAVLMSCCAYANRDSEGWVLVFMLLAAAHHMVALYFWPRDQQESPTTLDEWEYIREELDELERELFEAWAARDPSRYPLAPLKNGQYPDLRTQCAWEGWQR